MTVVVLALLQPNIQLQLRLHYQYNASGSFFLRLTAEPTNVPPDNLVWSPSHKKEKGVGGLGQDAKRGAISVESPPNRWTWLAQHISANTT